MIRALVRQTDWQHVFPAGCEGCDFDGECEFDPPLLVHTPDGKGYHWFSECPWKGMERRPEFASSAVAALEAWRRGKLGYGVPDASEALVALVLAVDDEVQMHTEDVRDRLMPPRRT